MMIHVCSRRIPETKLSLAGLPAPIATPLPPLPGPTAKKKKKTYHLQLILPKLLLARLVQKWEIAHMMHKNIPQNWQLRIDRRDLAELRFKRGAETVQGGGGVQLSDFIADLVTDEFALEILGLVRLTS